VKLTKAYGMATHGIGIRGCIMCCMIRALLCRCMQGQGHNNGKHLGQLQH
jgi:hypothetical protein